ncbi:uncharacterized protein LOC143469561 [Clavelina lepadiformis]|uniref:uncharacterized protein LOC143469561 n=1 Tax=Clavelina lepadiformis TaxID=159417 RepID=UPI0040424C70
MKVIVAGLSKTGTKSMADALRMLGYSVYDYMENYEYLHKDWEKIFAGDGTTDDFRRMYKDVDAITDTPAAYFWDEIHKAFPDAKIILTMRDNEERWFKSLKVQGDQVRDALNPLWYLSPTYQSFRSYTNNNGLAAYGTPWYETM